MVKPTFLVWSQQPTAQVNLQNVQRLACLGITGSITACPTISLESIVIFPPLIMCLIMTAPTPTVAFQKWNAASFVTNLYTGMYHHTIEGTLSDRLLTIAL